MEGLAIAASMHMGGKNDFKNFAKKSKMDSN